LFVKCIPTKPAPTLRQLRYLVAIVDRCHFGRAAEACLISQSTLSAAIQELEDLLGAPLLERTRRSVVPTALGREIASRAQALLKGAEDLVGVAQAARDPVSGPLHVGVIPTIGPFMLPRTMPALRKAFPQMKFYLREDRSARLMEDLNAGTLDIVVLALPYPTDDMETIENSRDRFWLVCPPEHRLCSVRSVQPADMAFEDLLLLEDGHCLREHALSACDLEGARRNVAFQGTSLHTLVQMVANGLGVTLLPEMALNAGILRGLDLAAMPLDGEASYRRIGLSWRRTSGRKETFRRVTSVLRDAMAEGEATMTGPIGTATTRLRAAV
jgi:LysR family transcriptional regulator, hydrogen peroxide-inducible genes activator